VHTKGQYDGLYVGDPQESILNKGQWIFGISKALRSEEGALLKVLNAIVDVKYFYRQYQELFSQSSSTLTISSPEGLIYTQIPKHDEHVGKKYTYSATPDDADFNKQRIIDGQVQLTAQRRLDSYPLIVSTSMPEAKALAAWYKSAWTLALISILACSALLFLTYRAAAYQNNEAQIKAKLQRQAITDSLTGLANRRHVLEEAQKEIKKAQRGKLPLALGLLDLDFFKKVNDLYGHQAGDEILVGVAELLRANCRESDVISRFGGEEFLLLFPATDLKGAIASAKKICESLAQKTFKTAAANIQITASLGVTQWGSDETDINEALRRADKALYQVKKTGRNGVKWLPGNLKGEKQSHSAWLGQRVG
jgi:diguanylate cyclase (GGDEF)-like protein